MPLRGLVCGGWLAGLLLGALAADTVAAAPAAGATRVVTLAPHLTEMVYAVGAGHRLVGTVEFSNTPEAARRLPRVGDAFRVDYERLLALRPDLVLGWPSGNSPALLARLGALGLRVEGLEPRQLADIGRQLARIGELTGEPAAGARAAARWSAGLAELRARHGAEVPLRVFYQVAPDPLVTVTAAHFIGQAIALCGGTNVFAAAPGLTPVVDREAVVAARPEAIVVSGLASAGGPSPLGAWQRWPALPAVARGRLYLADPDLMSIPGPRLLEGIGQLCRDLDLAREERPQAGALRQAAP